MDEYRELDARIREAMDACRAGSDDLKLPELASFAAGIARRPAMDRSFKQLQQCDLQMRSAMHDLPVPNSLAERLLRQLAATEPMNGPSQDLDDRALLTGHRAVAVDPDPVHASTFHEKGLAAVPQTSRLRWMWLSLATAACLLVAIGVAFWSLIAAVPTDVIALAQIWETELERPWKSMDKAPRSYFPAGISVPIRGWQSLTFSGGYRGVAFELLHPDRRRAVLFVVQVAPGGNLPSSPPVTPQFASGGKIVAAWLARNRMCVLVVDGDERAYRSLVRTSQPPLA